MRTMKMFILGCVVVLLVAGVVSFPKTAFGLEIVVGCAGPPSVTGSAVVTVMTTFGGPFTFPTTCTEGSRRASTEIAEVTSWSAGLNVTGQSGAMSVCGPFVDEPLPARFTCKHDTENVRLHVTVK